MKLRFYSIVVLITAWCAVLFVFQNTERTSAQNSSRTNDSRAAAPKMPTLNGAAAKEFLEKRGDYQSLVESVRRARADFPPDAPTAGFAQTKKLLASDGAPQDFFGSAVAVSGSTAIVGVPGDDNGSNIEEGSAYIFQKDSGGTSNWGLIIKLTAPDTISGDRFGFAVAIDGNLAVVGKPNAGGLPVGAVYVYSRHAGGTNNWGQIKKITLPEDYGSIVDISGDTIIAGNNIFTGGGSYHDDRQGLPPERIYIFNRNQGGTNNWGETAVLQDATDSLRRAAIDGDTIIAAPYRPNAPNGKAFVYERGANGWVATKTLTVAVNQSFEWFGAAVAIEDDRIAVSTSVTPFSPTGSAVYVFERNAGGASNWGETKRIEQPDGAAQDNFGFSVAVHADKITVGASRADVGANPNQGAAYVFERDRGGASNWGLNKKLTANDGATEDLFGNSVAASGKTILVGVPYHAIGANSDQGAAYVFESQNNTWIEDTKPLPANCTADDRFGGAVSISGDWAIVGAQSADVGANANQGAAYVFQKDAGGANNWGLVKILTASDGAANFYFGRSAAISGDTAIVGSNTGDNSGAAYIFRRDAGGANNWGEVKKITGADTTNNFDFGYSVDIDGDRIVVGAGGAAVGGNFLRGAAYIFERNLGGSENWGEVKKIHAADGAEVERFGEAVAVSGNVVVVGARYDTVAEQFQGSAYIFERDAGGAGNWGETKKLVAPNPTFFQEFGSSLAASGDLIVVGARGDKTGANTQQGAAYLYGRNQGGANNWGLIKKLTASDAGGRRYFGDSVAIEADTILVGSRCGSPDGNGVCRGSAYVFKQNAGGANFWGETKIVRASDRADYDFFGTFVGLSADKIIVGAPGDDVNGVADIGSSYIFTNAGADWVEEAKPIPSLPTDCGTDDQYGFSVAIDGDTAVVGAPRDKVGVFASHGSAYVLQRNQGGANNWGLVKILLPADGQTGMRFGQSAAIDGDSIVVGTDFVNINGNHPAGAAYVYERDAGGASNWGEVKKLIPSDGADGDNFGESVAVSGETIVVGAPFDDIGGQNDKGSAYIFERSAGGAENWGQTKKLFTAESGNFMEVFGVSVSIDGDTLIVGAPLKTVGNLTQHGAAYIYERDAGGASNWGEIKMLFVPIVPTPQINYRTNFGAAVDVEGDALVVGAPTAHVGDNDRQGAAYVFGRNQGGASNWGETKRITAADGAADDRFGSAVSLSGDTIIIGAPDDDINSNLDQGSAHIFEQNAGGANDWGRVKKLTDANGGAEQFFGSAVAASGNVYLVGAYQATINQSRAESVSLTEFLPPVQQGASYVFRGIAAPAPTAAIVAVGGRVTANKRGVSRAFVNLLDPATGESRTALTNSFGYYRFTDIAAGRSYLISVRHKQYRFDARVVTINEDLDDVNFSANGGQF